MSDLGRRDEPLTREALEIFVHDLTVEINSRRATARRARDLQIQQATMKRILVGDAALRAQLGVAHTTITALREETVRLRSSIEKLLTFKKMWERAYRDECRWQNQPEGEDRQALASGKED